MANEKRLDLIDRNKLKSEFEWLKSVVNESSKYEIQEHIQRIEDAPTVDAVEVVRCKDCKHNNMNGGDCNRTITMYHRDQGLELNVAEYIKLENCSYGERRTDDCT